MQHTNQQKSWGWENKKTINPIATSQPMCKMGIEAKLTIFHFSFQTRKSHEKRSNLAHYRV